MVVRNSLLFSDAALTLKLFRSHCLSPYTTTHHSQNLSSPNAWVNSSSIIRSSTLSMYHSFGMRKCILHLPLVLRCQLGYSGAGIFKRVLEHCPLAKIVINRQHLQHYGSRLVGLSHLLHILFFVSWYWKRTCERLPICNEWC